MATSWLNQSGDDRKSKARPRNKRQIIRQIRVDDRSKTTRRAWRHTFTKSGRRLEGLLTDVNECWPANPTMSVHIRIFFGGKTKRPCFDLFIHWLIKQITNTNRNHFSRSYEKRSMVLLIPVRNTSILSLRHVVKSGIPENPCNSLEKKRKKEKQIL